MPRLHPRHLLYLLLPVTLALSACGSDAPVRHSAGIHDSVARSENVTAEANDVLFHAINLVGTPYQWGGNTPDSGFDCSGLVDYVYRKAVDVNLPRTSHAMSEMDAQKIDDMDDLASGDLLFFRTDGDRISHVAIYVGNGRFVHAPNSGGVVRLDYLSNPYWHRHFAFARRVLR